MKVGVWFYGLGSVLTGILDIAWGAFDAYHQPIQTLGNNLPGQHILAYVAGVWLVAAGLAILWRRSVRIGAAACGIIYLIFAALWLPRYYGGIHVLGWRIDVLLGVSFGLGQQLLLSRSGSNHLRVRRLNGFSVARESGDRRTLDVGIASYYLRHIPTSPAFASSQASSRSGWGLDIFGRRRPGSPLSWQDVQFAQD